MLKKLYDKSKLWFALCWIIAYCFLMSLGDRLSQAIGVEKSITLAIGILLSVLLLSFLYRYDLARPYGLCKSKVKAQTMLYYLPLVLMLTVNLWNGVTMHYGWTEIVLYILSMFCVGFLEETIFRGLLFKSMRGDNLKAAVIVSGITFGMGHIINLFNGSGAELLPNLLQVIYAAVAGFMFVMIYLKTDSLLICILTHGLFNALSVFAKDAPNLTVQIVSCLLLTLLTASYAAYIARTMRKSNDE